LREQSVVGSDNSITLYPAPASVGVESFFVVCAEYVLRHHRKLAVVRREIREEEKRLRRKKKERLKAARAAYRANPSMYLGEPPKMPRKRKRVKHG
jgi:hypothetical protein